MNQQDSALQPEVEVSLALSVYVPIPIRDEVGFIHKLRALEHVTEVHKVTPNQWFINTDLPPSASQRSRNIVEATKTLAPSYW